MGLLTGILTLPVAPLRGTLWVAEQVRQQAEEAYYDPAAVRRELDRVQELRDAGDIDAQTADAWEDQLIERLLAGQERGTRG